METLKQIQDKYNFKTDKGTTHNYLKEYEKLFNKYKYDNINLLEIGILHGESLKLWATYFPNAKIYGIDNFVRVGYNKVSKNLKNFDNIYIFNVDSRDPKHSESRNKFFSKIADIKFKFIIDDGSHQKESQVETFENFNHLLCKGGKYIIEDIRKSNKEYIINHIKNIKILDKNNERKIRGSDNILGIYHNEIKI